ncbi:unnamed protein product [Parnassius mnemosyne]|uniref:Reverse transcriptase domain-containing protein n=1 Tax=Parnassius mnemosyne TaxID=213953 RepID=A0AAV1K9F5_9NEOP
MEYLFLEINLKGVKAILGVVYSPPSINYFSTLESILDNICSEYTHQVIMGDFNTDLLKNSSNSQKLRSIINSVNLSILPLKATHSNFSTADSWIDLIITSSNKVASYGQFPAPGFSNHDLIFLSYKLKPPKHIPHTIKLRSYARLNRDSLINEVSAIDWSSVLNTDSINDMVMEFNSKLLNIYNTHAPEREVKIKRPSVPWITSNVRLAMNRRNRAFVTYKSCRTVQNWEAFKKARNRCNQVVRSAKRRYFHDFLNNSSQSETWKFIHSHGLSKTKKQVISDIFPLNDLNVHFSSSACLPSHVKLKTISDITSMSSPHKDSFSFSTVTEKDILKVLQKLKSKAVGHDNIGRTMISYVSEHIVPILASIINRSLLTGNFPSCWQKAFVLPLPKISMPSALNHFRPISILPFLSKVLEAVALKQIQTYLTKSNLLNQHQSGFRPGHSTTTALLKITEDVRDGMEFGRLTVLVLIDFSNAFNTVDHDILIAILSYIGFSLSARNWVSSYLRGRQQAVRVDGMVSDWCELTTGVPQGGILSPLLFSIFINMITCNFRASYHMYADDLQLYAHADATTMNNAITVINSDLNWILNWSRRYGVTVNPSKCQAIALGSARHLGKLNHTSLDPLIYNGVVIPYSSHVRDLGLSLDCSLTWRSHVEEVSRKVCTTLRQLYRFKNILPPCTKKLLIESLILPMFDYADVCYLDADKYLVNKLDRLLNNCIRFIYGLRKYDHVSFYRSQLKWLNIPQRRNLRILSTLFTILNDPLAPEYLKCKFQYLGSSHDCNLRSRNNLVLQIPSHRTGFLSNSFAVTAVRLWNTLPLAIRKSPNKWIFKTNVKEHYLGSSDTQINNNL